MAFKPLLAYTVKDADKLDYPQMASPKLDGIRCVMQDDMPVSRTLKPIPNHYIQDELRCIRSLTASCWSAIP